MKLADRRLNKHAYMLHTRKASKDTLHAAFIQATRALTQDSHVSVRLSLQFETKYFPNIEMIKYETQRAKNTEI